MDGDRNWLELQGRVCVVTGAASGIGASVAQRLAAVGAKVALLDRDAAGLQERVAELQAAGAQVLGGFEVGEGARIGSNAVVVKPVPAGATAVGNPARIIQADADVRREQAASQMGFSAYGVTQSDDPLSQAMRGLIDNAASQEHQIALLWQTLEKMSELQRDWVPADAARQESFEAAKLNQMVGK